MPDLAQDPRGSGRPDKRARVLIVLAKVLTNGSNEFSHAAKRSTPNALARDLREPALHQVQPRGPRGDEMEMVARALSEPLLHLGMFVRAVVVHDQMNLPPTRSLPIDALHKVQKLLMPMSRQAATDDGALQDIERGEQRRRAVTDVVVSLTSRESGAHGQRGLRTVESLDLTLLVNAQHQGLVRRVQVQPDHIAQLPHEVVGLYLNPPDKALVLCVDEKSQIQALDRTQPGLPIKKGRCGTMTHDYKRNGTTTLFAALSMLDGKVIGDCMPRHRHQEFIRFLNKIDAETPCNLDLHLIVDNYATHKHPRVKSWVRRHPRFHIHFIPTSSSWLNLVERWFREITDKRIRRGSFQSVPELIAAIKDYLKCHNQNPRVFVWNASAESIMSKIAKCKEALGTLH